MESKVFNYRLSVLLAIIGVLCCICSLFLPAIKHGKVLNGFECAALCLVLSFSGYSKSSSATELVLMCQIALVAMVLAPTIFFCRSIRKEYVPNASLIAFLALVAMVIFLLSVPYRGIEKTYVGFYTWLSGLLLIGLAGVAEILTSFAKGGSQN
ncbi:MAG: hypothetical protein ACK48X_18810 [Planctomycetota bacterium]